MIPSISEVRGRIEATVDPTARYGLKLAYLTACRANELCGVSQPSDTFALPDNTVVVKSRAIGPTRKDVDYDTFDGVRVMRITLGILKRREEVQKVVALPLSGGFEPWTSGLSEFFSTLAPYEHLLPYPRWRLVKWIKDAGLAQPGKSNPLRHIRLNHLTTYYGFDGDDRTVYAGWTFASGSRTKGPQDEYLNLDWREYFPKLLKPLPTSNPMTPSLQQPRSA